MPPRISRSSLQGADSSKKPRSKARTPKKAQKRVLDAFSIASRDHPDRVKIRQHRLGESDVNSHRKRTREDGERDEDGDEEEGSQVKRRRQKGGDDDMSLDEGSDSEGNNWTMGHVGDDDDSDIDSDEAFGESDEERFEGFTSRGSSSNQKGKKPKRKRVEELADEDGDIDLNEDDSVDDEDEDEDDLGEDAIDLATALDQYEESEEEEKQQAKKTKKKISAFDDSDESPSEGEDLAADGALDFSSDEDPEAESDKRAQLKDLISSLPVEEEAQYRPARKVDVHESSAPSEFGVLRKVDIASFKSKSGDPDRKKTLKLLQDDVKSSKRNDLARKLDAPLPKRQQAKLDRTAANEKANETLERWVATIKRNREAEHLIFPLKHPDAEKTIGERSLMPTTTIEPANDLESTIQSILQQSGLSNGKDDEENMQKWEELQTNKMPLEEVMKRRAQLRKERELLFREEIRAKRVKKIKSKAYRRVHRKERERLLERERNALRADGMDVSEDEREYNDRRRAEERMGSKHRGSKWAKGVKKSGKAAWDEDARSGVTEMARRNEELRRRIEGKDIRDDGDDASDVSSEDDDDEEDADEGNDSLKRQVDQLKENPFSTAKGGSKLASMAFMQKAEAAKRTRNDEDIERIRKELAGEDSDDDSEDEHATNAGRRRFGPETKAAIVPAVQVRGEFEERPGSDDEDAERVNGSLAQPDEPTHDVTKGPQRFALAKSTLPAKTSVGAGNPYLQKATKEKKSEQEPDLVWKAQDTISAPQKKTKVKSKNKKKGSKQSEDDDEVPEPIISAPDEDGFQTVTYQHGAHDDENESENEGIDLTVALRTQHALTAKAFAGDDTIEASFAAEKAQEASEDDEKTISTTLPGWGSWTGDQLTKNERRRKPKATVTKQAGVRPDKRKDINLDRVIISEKRVKPSTKFLATQLPFPFETKEQYERSLRLPKGPEWTTKQTFQDGTKPRVIVKQGVIRPMRKPLV
ncbi:Utp14 protein-domain-containing protein [Massariosphaeria phaeospora]|uniref:Utp14 protein-domain-containing protein n=1 Tax=Massariosphaeria phaeospora TaxID=100035 RepID=A0A7C8IEJ4_9PLEO|nr:Utp14 protein-domain-containing protein [Massariosphaeria phaeospora]